MSIIRMPVVLVDRLPLPSLRAYSAVSVLLLSCSLYYAFQITNLPEWKVNRTQEATDQDGMNPNPRNNDTEPAVRLMDAAYFMIQEPLCIWTLINMAYCCLILIGKFIQKLVFGELRVSEQQHVKDKFWNFVFYKFIFIFGVMNVQFIDEVVLWCSWFSVLGFFHLLAQLCKDRFEYLSFSPTTPKWTHIRLLTLLMTILVMSSSLFVVCIFVGLHTSINTFAFMAAECVLLILRTLYVIVRYAIHLWDISHDGVWENRGTYIYFTELIFELTALTMDSVHHLHMLKRLLEFSFLFLPLYHPDGLLLNRILILANSLLFPIIPKFLCLTIWGNIFLSMASLVICMQLRYLFYEIQRRMKKHKNYLRVVRHMEKNYPMALAEELDKNSDDCAICWDKMETARKLPCGHLFHNSCLRSWLEQDTSCPTCRTSLSDNSEQETNINQVNNDEDLLGGLGTNPPDSLPDSRQNRTTTNHFFHFDGSRYVSWFPSFSVEVTHTPLLARQHVIQTSQLDNMARQVQQMFPSMPLALILDDLRSTRSVELTIENILEERLVPPPFPLQNSRLPSVAFHELSRSSSEETTSSHVEVEFDTKPLSEDDEISTFLDELTESDNEGLLTSLGGRFSKSSEERERMLARRKEEMLAAARKKYLAKMQVKGVAGKESSGENPQSFAENRRHLAYQAAQRRLAKQKDS